MILRDIDFGPVWGASGVEGFFGEGYFFHEFFRPFGLSFEGMTFVAKTTPLYSVVGNMPLRRDHITPKEWKPSCIKVKFLKGAALNAVGLSSPGPWILFSMERWQERTAPFFLSFAAVGKSRIERLGELKGFIALCKIHFPSFKAAIGLQLNFSCPNTGHNAPEWRTFVKEILESLAMAAELGIPLVPKLSVLFPQTAAKEIAEHPACDALCVSNTIPWGACPDKINWKGLFGSEKSPLALLGGGGLSGKPIFPLVAKWLREAKQIGISKPICAGGGILSVRDIETLASLGADAVSLGSVAILRPWRVQKLIKTAHAVIK